MIKKLLLGILVLVAVSLIVPEIAHAAAGAVKLPNWASTSNLEQDLSSKGQKIANIIASIVGILGVIGMLVGAGCFPLNKPDLGKAFVVYSAIGLVVAGSVYGMAALVV